MAEQQAATSEVQQPLSPQPAAAPSSLPAYRALTRSARIPSCVLDRNDIRRLYRELSVPAQEAIDRQISAWERPPGTPPSHWKQVTEQARQIGKLLVLVEGKGGQQIIGASEEVLGEDGLPDVISAVTFDSSLPFENFAKQKPTDWFRLRLDLTEPPSLGAYNPWEEATPNKSTWEVTGANDT